MACLLACLIAGLKHFPFRAGCGVLACADIRDMVVWGLERFEGELGGMDCRMHRWMDWYKTKWIINTFIIFSVVFCDFLW